MERLRQLRADLEAWFGRLAPRERALVGAAGVALVVFALALGYARLQRGVALREAAIERKTQVLSQVGQLAQGYRQVQAERGQLEARLRGPPLQLMSFVAQTGQRLGIEVNDLRPGTAEAAGPGTAAAEGLSEETVEVSLAKLGLDKLGSLLQELERGPGVVKVRRLAMRGRNDDPAAVDVTLVVATYRLRGA